MHLTVHSEFNEISECVLLQRFAENRWNCTRALVFHKAVYE